MRSALAGVGRVRLLPAPAAFGERLLFRFRSSRASARPVGADVGYDPRGFLHVSLTNDGPALVDAVLDLLIPANAGPGWIARVDQEGQPQMESGSFQLDAEEPIGGRPSLHWHETEYTISNGLTLLRFFIGIATTPAEMPVVLRVHAPPGRTVEFASTVSRTLLT